MEFRSIKEFVALAQKTTPKRLVVAAAEGEHALRAVSYAKEKKIILPVLVGDLEKIRDISHKIQFDLSGIDIYDYPSPSDASLFAVKLINEGKADILMKGLVPTHILLKAILNNEHGLKKEKLLSHIALFESPYYHKLLCITDAAMNIAPDLADKISILNNAVSAYQQLGIEKPKVAIIAAVETVNPKMQACVDAAQLKEMYLKNQILGCILDGPLALDNAISKKAAEHKNINSDVAGDADILLMHDINSGNILYKSLNFLGGASNAAVLLGAKVPVVLTSRADSDLNKFNSIALAAVLG